MEVTGQAFEDMQEQNSRLIQQLREKDDANFKLMTERIKSNQLHKLAREEKDVLKEQVKLLFSKILQMLFLLVFEFLNYIQNLDYNVSKQLKL